MKIGPLQLLEALELSVKIRASLVVQELSVKIRASPVVGSTGAVSEDQGLSSCWKHWSCQ